jgi:streptogramin lyase
VTEFDLLTPSPVGDITAGPDGNIWFTKPDGHKIGRITSSGAVTEFDVPGGRPYGIAAGPDGNVWFTDKSLPRIGRITPAGEITQFPSSGAAYAIVTGADGNLWAAGHLTLMRITPSGSMTDFFLPAMEIYGWYPPAIAPAPDGSIWVTDPSDSQIVRFSLNPTACVTDPTTLCLNNGRFRVTADWRTRDGSTGQGRGVSLTPDSGYFWFFDAANVEVVVKVLNGCGSNSRYWTFAGGLTDVNVTLTVTDTQTGVIKAYTNPQGTPFQPIQDTSAFATCP